MNYSIKLLGQHLAADVIASARKHSTNIAEAREMLGESGYIDDITRPALENILKDESGYWLPEHKIEPLVDSFWKELKAAEREVYEQAALVLEPI